MNKDKETFIKLLRSTNRNGMENVVTWLNESDFFKAPASTNFHGNYDGGLMEHSMNVADMAMKIREIVISENPELEDKLQRNSVVIAALLHDICKANIYKPMVKYRKNANNQWETYDSYGIDYSEMPVGHGEKSVIRLLKLGLELTDDELIAIRWHMSAWDLPFQSSELKNNLNIAKEECKLLTVIQAADGIASGLLEKTVAH